MIAESLVVEITAGLLVLSGLIGKLVLLVRELRKTKTALVKVVGAIEHTPMHEEIIDEHSGDVVIDPRQSIKRAVTEQTMGHDLRPIIEAAVREAQ